MNLNPFKLRPRDPDPEADEEDSIEGEREIAPINDGLRVQNKIINWVVIGGACTLAAFLLYKYYTGMYHDYQENKAPAKDATRTVATATLPPLTMPPLEPVKVAAATSNAETLPPLQPLASSAPPVGGPATGPGQPPVKSLGQLVRERRLSSNVRFNVDGSAPTTTASGGVAAANPALATEPGTSDSDATIGASSGAAARPAVANAVPASFAASRAYILPDPTLMMTRGKSIPCTVLPAIDTTLNGIVTCITGEDATSADNKVSLMDRGTKCTGKQGGGVTQGQRRVGIIWDRCETPQHVLVPLDSGATDSLGRPGIPGKVNNHFWDRFGAAIALSLITDIGPYLAATQQGGNNNTTVSFPSISGSQDVMAEVLRNTMNIRPTIEAQQGARVLIYLAGDLDFRDVYQLERTK